MIQIESNSGNSSEQIVLCPNASASWHTNLYLIYVVAALALGIATGFALQGAWVILPFAGLEIGVLFGLLYCVSNRCNRMEVVRISAEQVVVERGKSEVTHVWTSPRFFTRLRVVPRQHPWYPQRVLLRGRESEIEIGAFLTESEKARLIVQLRQALNQP